MHGRGQAVTVAKRDDLQVDQDESFCGSVTSGLFWPGQKRVTSPSATVARTGEDRWQAV